jgi:hypothetical protein
MAGADDEMAAAGGYFLAADADRDRVIGTLRAAFTEGRLTGDEFDARVARAAGSRTYADLAAVTADIPAWPAGTGAAGTGVGTAGTGTGVGTAGTGLPANVKSLLWMIGGYAGLPPILLGVALMTNSEQPAKAALILFLIGFMLAITSGTVALGTAIDTRLKNRRGVGQPPTRP